jgi:hypothetical protein
MNILDIVKFLLSEDNKSKRTTRASIKQGGGDPDQYEKEHAAKKPKATKKGKKPSRASTLGTQGGLHDKKGKPAKVTSNHPDYLKKKLYKRGTKPKGYGKQGDSSEAEPIERVHGRGMTNKSKARQQRWAKKQARLVNPTQPKKDSYADKEYKDIIKGGDKDFN